MDGNKSLTLPRSSSAENKTGSRPVSFYDNFREANGSTLEKAKSKSLQNNSFHRNTKEITFEHEHSPTQVVCMNTTVPQNIVGSNIAGRHTPTRNSLRHSRMIVMSRIGKVPKKSLPPVLRYCKLATGLVGLQTLLGMALCFLSLWLLIWTPNLRTRDNPYWSGFPLVLSGILGLMLLCCCRKEYPGMSKSYCVYAAKVLSIFLSTVSSVTCFIACAFSLIHLLSLTAMDCETQHHTSCVCKVPQDANHSLVPIKSYRYADLNCPEVENILTILLIFSCATNFLGGVVSVWYVYLHWSSRYMYTYSKVRTKEDGPVVISNT